MLSFTFLLLVMCVGVCKRAGGGCKIRSYVKLYILLLVMCKAMHV